MSLRIPENTIFTGFVEAKPKVDYHLQVGNCKTRVAYYFEPRIKLKVIPSLKDLERQIKINELQVVCTEPVRLWTQDFDVDQYLKSKFVGEIKAPLLFQVQAPFYRATYRMRMKSLESAYVEEQDITQTGLKNKFELIEDFENSPEIFVDWKHFSPVTPRSLDPYGRKIGNLVHQDGHGDPYHVRYSHFAQT